MSERYQFVFYFEELGAHTHVTMFCSCEGRSAKTGDLIMNAREFAAFRRACERVGFEFKPREREVQYGCL